MPWAYVWEILHVVADLIPLCSILRTLKGETRRQETHTYIQKALWGLRRYLGVLGAALGHVCSTNQAHTWFRNADFFHVSTQSAVARHCKLIPPSDVWIPPLSRLHVLILTCFSEVKLHEIGWNGKDGTPPLVTSLTWPLACFCSALCIARPTVLKLRVEMQERKKRKKSIRSEGETDPLFKRYKRLG